MRGKLVVGNWKMNGGLKQNDALLADLRAGWTGQEGRALAVCVPYAYLWQAQAALSGSPIAWGAQDLSERPSGAYTGDVSAAMVAEFGCTYAIVGHSERRSLHGESDELVARKAEATLAAGLKPIVCVGETLAQRDAGETEAVVLRQLDAVIARLGVGVTKAAVAYEPVWAIGTGEVATPEDAQEVCAAIRERVCGLHGLEVAAAVRILYGGSVKPDNMPAIMAQPDIDGALVGGASLDYDGFVRICRYREAYA